MKIPIDKIKRIRKQYGFPMWLIIEAIKYYDGDEDETVNRLTEIYRAIGDHPDVVIEKNIEKFMDEIRYSKVNKGDRMKDKSEKLVAEKCEKCEKFYRSKYQEPCCSAYKIILPCGDKPYCK